MLMQTDISKKQVKIKLRIFKLQVNDLKHIQNFSHQYIHVNFFISLIYITNFIILSYSYFNSSISKFNNSSNSHSQVKFLKINKYIKSI